MVRFQVDYRLKFNTLLIFSLHKASTFVLTITHGMMLKERESLSDQKLLVAFCNGDRMAYDILFKRYYATLYSFALKNVKNSFVAEELVMDVMMALWKKNGKIVVEQDLKPYLFRSVKNAMYNHFRKNILDTVPFEDHIQDSLQSTRPADDHLIYTELEEIYHQKLNELSPARRKVFQMSREENKSYAEIARDLNLSVNTVENYMVAALNFFRQNIKEHADFVVLLIAISYFCA